MECVKYNCRLWHGSLKVPQPPCRLPAGNRTIKRGPIFTTKRSCLDKSSEVIGTKVSTDLGVANGGQFVPDTTKYPVQESETGTGSSSNLVHPEVDRLLKTLPINIAFQLRDNPDINDLQEVVMDVGRYPEAYFKNHHQSLQKQKVTEKVVQWCMELHDFGADNRAGIEGTLHRICCLRDRYNKPAGMTIRVGRAIEGITSALEDVMTEKQSILLVGRPGVGKTTILRDMARVLSTKVDKRVMIVDTSSEIGGYGEVPHSAVGDARRFQVPLEQEQYRAMVEAVQNHTPEVIVVDELGGQKEMAACQSIG